MIEEIKKQNGDTFLIDLKKVRDVMVFAEITGTFFSIKKSELKETARTRKIKYVFKDNIFLRQRRVMVIL